MKNCLIVVDYQKDFVSGSLGFPKAAELDARIAEKIRTYRENGDVILFTLDTHCDTYLQSREGRFLPVLHCIKGTTGHDLYGETGRHRRESDLCFEKTTFGSDELYEHLKRTPYARIELVGVVSNICVLSNAVLAHTAQPETDLVVDRTCVASNDEQLQEAALCVMESMQIRVTGDRKMGGEKENG